MKSTVDVPRAAKIGSEAVIALKVNVAVVSVHVLLLTGNVIQMFVGTVGSVVVMVVLGFLTKKVITMNVGI